MEDRQLRALKQERAELRRILEFGVHRESYRAYLRKCLEEVERKITEYEKRQRV